MRIGVPREIHAGERRVATTPDVAAQLIKLGYDVTVESGAGVKQVSRTTLIEMPAATLFRLRATSGASRTSS